MERTKDIIEVNTVNFSMLAFVHLVDVKEVLSITLLAVSIGYTVWKWRAGK
jgi:hypothetical protein